MKLKLLPEDIIVGNVITNGIHEGIIKKVNKNTFDVKFKDKDFEYTMSKQLQGYYLLKNSSEVEDIISSEELDEED